MAHCSAPLDRAAATLDGRYSGLLDGMPSVNRLTAQIGRPVEPMLGA